jgi:hypothetical protein
MCDQVKYCNKCKRTLPLATSFHKRSNRKNGYKSICKECQKKYPRSKQCAINKRNYQKKRYHEDQQYNISKKFRRKVRKILKLFLEGKLKSTKDQHRDYLGCSISYYKDYIESKFQEGMTWENYGVHGWHLDHIIPCTAFDLTDPEQIKKCFHYTNTQPLWAKDNINKSNTIPV